MTSKFNTDIQRMIKKLLTKLKILKKEESPEECTVELMLLSAVSNNSRKIIIGDPIENIPRKHLSQDTHNLSLENQYLKLSDLDQLEEEVNADMEKRTADIVEYASYDEVDKLAEEFINEIISRPGKVPVWHVKDDELLLFNYSPYWIYSEAKKYFETHGDRVDFASASVEISTAEERDYTYSINLKYNKTGSSHNDIQKIKNKLLG